MAFARVVDAVSGCGARAGEPVLDQRIATRVTWHSQGFSPVSGETGTTHAGDQRVVINVVLTVTTGLFDDRAAITALVADKIGTKVTSQM